MTGTKITPTSPLLDLLFDKADAGLCLVAPDGTIVQANAEWLRSTGFTRDVLGEDIIELFPASRDMTLAMHARARAGHHLDVPRHALVVNGRETWWEGSIDPVPMEGGTGLLITAREAKDELSPRPDATALIAEYLHDVGPAGIVLFEPTPPFRVLANNRAYQELWPEPLRSRGLAGLALAEYLPGAEESGVAEIFRTVARTGAARRVDDFAYDGLPGGTRWFSWTVSPVVRDGRVVALVNMAVDVSREVRARKEAEAAAAESRHAAELLELGDPFCELDREFRVIRVNAAHERVNGHRREQILGRTHWEVWPESANPSSPYWREYHRCVEERVPVQFDAYYAALDVWTSVSAYPTAQGGVAIFWRDDTARKRAEAAMRESEARLRLALDAAKFGTFDLDLATGHLVWDDVKMRMWGIANREGFRYPAVLDQIHPEDRSRVAAAVEAALRTGEYESEYRVTWPDGTVHWLYARARVEFDQGRPVRMIGVELDITDRKRAEQALRESQQLLQSTLHHFPTVIAFKDREGRFLDVNPAVERALGVPKDRIVGRTLRDFMTDEAAVERLWAQERAVMERRQAVQYEAETPLPSGTLHHVNTAFPLIDDAGRVYGTGHISHDITAAKVAEQALREANERLVDADRRKDEFLGMLSHELRNPLAPIRNASYILGHADAGSDAARRARLVIERQTEHITRLVDDLLDVTRISRGKIELRRSTVDLREVVVRAAEDFRLVMEDKGIRFETVLPEGCLAADVDVVRVTQVIGNLLHNASKFTRRGDAVTLSLMPDGGDAVISVRDTGKGIEPGLLSRVFEAFVQGDSTLARTEGGLGLGLALVKGIAEMHGGAASVSSAGNGKGSEFVVRLPLRESRARDVAAAPSGPRPSATAAKRVLVVDDNHDAADTLADLVRMLGHEAEVVYDGPGALRAARAQLPDLVLCDIGLPGMNGYEVARALRSLATRQVRIIAVSGYAQPEDVARAIDAGFDGHVAKPPDPAQLESVLGQ